MPEKETDSGTNLYKYRDLKNRQKKRICVIQFITETYRKRRYPAFSYLNAGKGKKILFFLKTSLYNSKMEGGFEVREKTSAVLSNSLRPRPDVLVTCRYQGKDNLLAVTCAANAGYDPPMVIVGIVPSRYSYHMIKESGVFAVNLVTEEMRDIYAFAGSKSGRDMDKFQALSLTKRECVKIDAPFLDIAPVAIECKVTGSIRTGSHEMFAATIEYVHADKELVDEKGFIRFSKLHFLTFKELP